MEGAAMQGGGISEMARAVLAFWFQEVPPERRFAKDPDLDALIRERFGPVRAELIATNADAWRLDADTILAAIIVLDQFSRNMFRDSAEAFAADPLALELCLSALSHGHHHFLQTEQRAFLFMPLMHCENPGVQRFALRCYAQPGLEHNLEFAREHAAVIDRFGRFPTRNVALGRTNTAEEEAYLAQPDAGW